MDNNNNNNKNLSSLILSISIATMIMAGIIFASNIYTPSDSNSAKALTKLFSNPTIPGKPNKANISATSTASITNTSAQGTSRMSAMLSQPASSSHLLTYQNPLAGFKIEYPSFWQKSENITSNSSAAFFSEPLSGVRFTVANLKIPQTALLNEPKNLILNTYLSGFTQPFQPYNSTQSSSAIISGNPVNRTELTYLYAGHPARITILSSLIGDKVYILSYAATRENYALFLPTAQQMINSFSILPAVTNTSATLANQTAVPRPNVTNSPIGTAANILVNIDACNPKSQNPLSPKSVAVQVGGMVNWTNSDKNSHEFVSGTPNALTNLFDSGLIDPGKSAGVTFKKPGTFSYFDSICSNLNGTISVVPSPKIQQQAVAPGSSNSTKLPTQQIIPPSPNATAHTQPNETSKLLPQPPLPSPSQRPSATLSANITGKQQPSQKPAATIQAPQQQQQQQQPLPLQQQAYTQGFSSKGMINSLINTPTAAWIATGTWIMNVDNGTVTFFDTHMSWYNNNGATSHTHEFQSFKSTSPAKIILFPNGPNSVSFKGIMDVGTNHRIVWKNVPTTIDINGKKTITISVADNATNHHFAGQPIFGLVSSFVPCSDIPGPNMEVLQPCTNQH